METCLLKRWTARSRLKTSSKWKASKLPNVEHISIKDWMLLKESLKVGSWPWQQQKRWQQPWENKEWQASKESPLERAKNKPRPTPTSWHLISLILPRKWKSAIVLRGLNNMSQHPWGASNAKNIGTAGKLAEDEWHMPSEVKKTQTTLGDCLMVIRCPNCLQNHPAYSRSCDVYKKRKGNIRSEAQKEYNLLESKENSRVVHGRKHTSVAWRVDPINQDNKSRALVEKLIQLELNDLPKFQGHLKKKLH